MSNLKATTSNHCAYCEATLSAWNAQACAHCGKKICSHHAQIRRSPFSRVLYSVCLECSSFTTARSTTMHKNTTKARETSAV